MTNISIETKKQAIATNRLSNLRWVGVNNCKSIVYKTSNSLNTKTKRAFAAFLALLLLAPWAARAQNFGGGSGAAYDPYIIATTDHWLELAASVNSGNSYEEKFFSLTADLDFSGINFMPIGGAVVNNNDTYFAGFFDGRNHSILNVQVGASRFAGLFGNIWRATVKNLTLGGNSWIEGNLFVGGIVGRASYGEIYNCRVEKTVTIAASQNSSSCIGGIAGQIYNGSVISNCSNVATVTSNGKYYVRYVGGIAGDVWTDGPIIRGCMNYGTVDGFEYVGGVVGRFESSFELTECYTGAYCTLFAVGQSGSSQGINLPGQANSMHTITFGENVHYFISPWAGVAYFEGKYYYEAGEQVAFKLYPDSGAPEGYLPLFDVNGVQHRPGNDIEITMPAEDVVITVSGTLRDIAYTPWVSVVLSPGTFEYNGSQQVPTLTVTDTKDGMSMALIEGTDYEAIQPSNPIYPGTYTIVIKGLGGFGGTVEAQYSITSPPSNWIGEGTAENPYLIFTTDDMDRLAQRVRVDQHSTSFCSGEFFSLQNDLDYSGKDYSPIGIGTSWRKFDGTFNGNGHTIRNVVIQGNDEYPALFGHIGDGGVVSGLTLGEGSSIEGSQYVGGIVAWCEGGTVSDCSTAVGVTIKANNSVGAYAGGIVSKLNSAGYIANCLNRANVLSNGNYYSGGGIVGELSNDNSIVTGCVNEGTISGSQRVGGIVAFMYSGRVECCLNLGAVSASGNSFVGGVVGGQGDGIVSNNYYAGECSVQGIGAWNNATGNDANGAQRGHTVSGESGITLALLGSTGLAYNGTIYAGSNENINLSISPPEGYMPFYGYYYASDLATLTQNGDVWTLVMPDRNVTIMGDLGLALTVPGYGESDNGGYRLIASPVVGSLAASAVGNIFGASAYDLYRFDQSEELEWRNHKDQAFELENGKGYLYASKEDVNLVFRGTYNTATEPVEVPLTYDQNGDFAGWNLVGNTFPVAAYADKSYYKMNAAGTAIEPVAVSSSTAIDACTGVMVKAETTGETVTFSRTAQQSTGNNGTIQIAVAQADTRGNAIQDKAIVSFNADDRLEKFVFGETDAKIYIPQGGKDYAVATVGRDAPWHVSTTDEIPINFKAAKNGTYTLTFDTQHLDLEYLHLIDNLTGADIDLIPLLRGQGGLNDTRTSTASYTFTAKTTDYASRFRLVFSASADETSANRPFAYIADGEIRLVETCHGASLQVVDMMGRVVVSTDVARNVSTSGIAPGVYVLRLINGENVRTQKIVID